MSFCGLGAAPWAGGGVAGVSREQKGRVWGAEGPEKGRVGEAGKLEAAQREGRLVLARFLCFLVVLALFLLFLAGEEGSQLRSNDLFVSFVLFSAL